MGYIRAASSLAAVALWIAKAAAHGHVALIVVDGVGYEGYDAPSWYNSGTVHEVIGWTESATDNGFVAPAAYQDPDIICHRNATNAPAHATVQAGDKISLHWTPWPASHHGPVLDYLAKCDGLCEEVDKTSLEFFKIDNIGFLNYSIPNGGFWAADVLREDGNSWLVQIPEDLEPGNYVLRHEIIALHSAGSENGAQNYPQCINLKVEGTGTMLPSGIPGTALYKETDPGIWYNIYTSPEVYTMPGPTLVSGLPSSVSQMSSVATVNTTATVPGSTGSGGGGSGPTTVMPTTTTGGGGGNGGQPTTTTVVVKTTTSASSGNGGGNGNCASLYGQCGGSGWSGPTCCSQGSCQESNQWYSQCLN